MPSGWPNRKIDYLRVVDPLNMIRIFSVKNRIFSLDPEIFGSRISDRRIARHYFQRAGIRRSTKNREKIPACCSA